MWAGAMEIGSEADWMDTDDEEGAVLDTYDEEGAELDTYDEEGISTLDAVSR